MASELQIACPGDQLADADSFLSGPGTFVLGQHIFASVVGKCVIFDPAGGDKPILSVSRNRIAAIVPNVGDLVTCRVTKTNARQAHLEILCVGEKAVKEAFPAIIRARDVRAFEVDNVEIFKSFRPGDIVRAEVISMGDSRAYFLSTAKNHLGVVSALSSSGKPLKPVSWEEMADDAGVREFRKVAKVDP